jgi:gas vesicle protein
MGNKTNSFLAFVAGAAAGAVAGVLFAPTSGKETRDKLNKELDEFSDLARKAAAEQYNQAVDKLEDAKNSAVKYVEDQFNAAKKTGSGSKN